ncbi:hypothetical protein Ndes2526B_g01091 [Nannochloris sp. 'desiccata']|nr:putative DNA damage-repair/toleration protein [Chlorella desiccata (nom. nud.)]
MKFQAIFVATSLLLALSAQQTLAGTDPDQYDMLVEFRDAMLARPGQSWTRALSSWTCPTRPDNSFGGSCDPCGQEVWGNWEHMACRGPPVTYTKDAVPGIGVVTNVHITDYGLEGAVPLQELCGFKSLREFDLDGGRLTGEIPTGFAECFPQLREIDLSYNQLSGEIPAAIADVQSLQQFKVDVNQITGPIPEAYGNMKNMNWLRLGMNKMTGRIPQSLSNTRQQLSQLGIDNNDFEGDLYPLAKHQMISFLGHNNPKLCGMVPVGVRFAHGFNFYNTGLGMPCPEEIANGLDTE